MASFHSIDVGSDSEEDNSNVLNEKSPMWNHVVKIGPNKPGGGCVSFRCKYCDGIFTGSYTRVKAHLLRTKTMGIQPCSKVSSPFLITLKQEMDKADELKKKNQPNQVPLPPSCVGSSNPNSSSYFQDPKKRKIPDINSSSGGSGGTSNFNPIFKAFNSKEREELTLLIARMFYAAGLPFNFARNQYWIDVIQYACNHNLGGYVPPGYNKLRTTLLQREREHIDNLLATIRGTWPEKGLSIVTDGWSDPQRRPLINFMAVNFHGPVFLKAVNTFGEVKDKHFIAQQLKQVIMEVGSRNVVQIITDNAANCKAAGQLIEAEFPHIVWTPCVVHTLNLALKNICAAKNTENNEVVYDLCHWISDIAGDALVIKNYILNHSMRNFMYLEVVPLKLLSVAETRFASTIVMLKRFRLIKHGLQRLVTSEKWDAYRESNGDTAAFVKGKICDDRWWDKMDYILAFTRPIYDMIRICDTDHPCLHLVYDMWDTMIEKVKKVIYKAESKGYDEESEFFNVVHAILVDRWNKNNTPLHCLAHSLNPRFYSRVWLDQDPSRVPPHYDVEVTHERNRCFNRYFEDPMERSKVRVEYAHFSGQQGDFGDVECMRERGEMDPRDWWLVYGANAPLLQRMALKVLGQPSSLSCSERNWSTYAFIHSAKRNKILPQRAEDLVFVHSNLRLLARRSPRYNEGETKLWDIAGDACEDMDDVGSLGVANLSLDEPEVEDLLYKEVEENVPTA